MYCSLVTDTRVILRNFMFFNRGNQAGEVCSADKQLKDFVKQHPSSKYTFDSQRGASESEICREVGKPGSGRECITVKMESKRMFTSMQELGFFCLLPQQVGKTHIECTPLPKP